MLDVSCNSGEDSELFFLINIAKNLSACVYKYCLKMSTTVFSIYQQVFVTFFATLSNYQHMRSLIVEWD